MAIEIVKYIRKPLYVDAVRITNGNFDEIVAWCGGNVEELEVPGKPTKKFVKVDVHNPKNTRQTQAFVGDWLLRTEKGYKVYTNKAFRASFDEATEQEEPKEMPHPADDLVYGAHEIAPGVTLNQAVQKTRKAPPTNGRTNGDESPEMKLARETIEAEGGTVEPATPDAIAAAALQNAEVRTEA